jgi:mRNA-degrading endonuclease RelE of RelBE toxin-antitoxin system
MRVTVEPQPREFIRRQPPATRRRLRDALHAIERGQCQPEPLEDELDGFYKVKVDSFRIIVQAAGDLAGPFLRVVFIERRKVVYELFSQILGLE